MTRIRRRIAALATVSFLALGSTVVIAGAAQALQDPPTITGPATTTSSTVDVAIDVVGNGNNYSVTVLANGTPTTCIGFEYFDESIVCQIELTAGFGTYALTATTDDGEVSLPSAEFEITYGGTGATAITVPGDNQSIDADAVPAGYPFQGTGPAMASLEIAATPATGGGAPVWLCSTTVSAAGTWTCNTSFPEFRDWDIIATATDVDGTPTSSANLNFETRPSRPGLSVMPLIGSADVTVNGVAGSDTAVSLYTEFGGSTTLAARCPEGWDGSYSPPPSSGSPLVCGFPLPTGIHLFSSVQFVNDVYSSDRGDLIRVPAVPSLDAVGVAGGLQLSGTVADEPDFSSTVNTGSLVSVYREVPDDAPEFVCSDDVDTSTGEWGCTAALPDGDYAVYAFAQSTGFADDTAVAGSQNGYHNGVSDYSETVLVTALPAVPPGVPDVDYVFGPGSVGVTATGEPLGGVAIRVYETSDNGEGYNWDLRYGCPTVIEGEGLYVPFGESTESCTFPLAPGIWNFWTNQELYDPDTGTYLQSDYQDDYVLIPTTPTLGAVVNANRSVTFSGAGTPGYVARVHDAGGVIRCTDAVNEIGAWSCTYSPAAGESTWQATQLSQGFVANPGGGGPVGSYQGISAYSAGIGVVVPAAAVAPTPTPSPTPLVWSLKGLNKSELIPGETIILSSEGLPPGATIDVEINSTPRALGSTVVADDGTFSMPVTIPLDMEPGSHTLVVTLTPLGGSPSVLSQPVAILPLAPEKAIAPEQEPKSEVMEATGSGSGSGFTSTDRSDPGAPSSITESVGTWRDIIANPMTLLGAAGLGLALLLLVAFPAELLNSTLSSNSQRLGRGFAAIESAVNRATGWFISVTRTPAIAAAVIVLVTSVLFGFVDPGFGFDIVSLRLVLSLGIGLFVVSYVASFISSRVIKRAWGVEASIQLQPAALIFAALGVIVARALDFSPGFLVGLVIGLEIALSTREPYRSRAVIAHFGILVGICVLAWLGYSLATAMLSPEPGFVDLLVVDALAATTVEGLTAATVAMLPLGFLEGRNLFLHSKRLWFISFATIAALFCLLVLPIASGDSGVRDWLSWTLVLLGFAVVTLSLWAYFHFTGGRRTTRGDDPVSLDSPEDDPVTLDRVGKP